MHQRIQHLPAPTAIQFSRRAIVTRPAIVARRRINRDPSAIAALIDSDVPLPGDADPYEDYRRILTVAGGILVTYKDLDLRLRQTLWRVGAWSAFTGLEAWLVQMLSSGHPGWIAYLSLSVVAILNWLIVRRPSEVLRQIEIRPDCLILDGAEIFWRRHMEGELPSLKPDEEGNQVLSGIYGTRFVEFAVLRRFDEHDRAPEVFAAHLENAFAQLWSRDL